MNIAIIGSGHVGAALGQRWAKAGHQIFYGLRNPDDPKHAAALAGTGGTARPFPVGQAAAEAEVVALTTPWQAAQAAIHAIGDLDGKVLIDCTNPLRGDFQGLEVGTTFSAAEQIAAWAPGARVVKCFNTTGSGNMENPSYGSDRITMFLCGDDDDAKQIVTRLARDIGFDVADAGDLVAARYLEPVAMLWVHLAYACNFGTDIGFKLIRRGASPSGVPFTQA